MTSALSPQVDTPQPQPDRRVGQLYTTATIALLLAVRHSVSTAVAGDLVTATALLDRQAGEVRSRLLRDAPPMLRQGVRDAALRGTRRAEYDLGRNAIDPHVRDRVVEAETAKLTGSAEQVAFALVPAARKLFNRAMTAAQSAVHHAEQARIDAAQRALNMAADRGGIEFHDHTGHRWNADTYMRYATFADLRDTEYGIHHAWLTRNGIQLVYCTTTIHPCERCKPCEGRVFTIAGGAAQGPGSVLVHGRAIATAGSVASALASGLGHFHCGHLLVPMSSPTGVDTTPQGFDHATPEQTRQAQIQRNLRKWQRRHAVALTAEQRRLAAQKIRFWQLQLDAESRAA